MSKAAADQHWDQRIKISLHMLWASGDAGNSHKTGVGGGGGGGGGQISWSVCPPTHPKPNTSTFYIQSISKIVFASAVALASLLHNVTCKTECNKWGYHGTEHKTASEQILAISNTNWWRGRKYLNQIRHTDWYIPPNLISFVGSKQGTFWEDFHSLLTCRRVFCTFLSKHVLSIPAITTNCI